MWSSIVFVSALASAYVIGFGPSYFIGFGHFKFNWLRPLFILKTVCLKGFSVGSNSVASYDCTLIILTPLLGHTNKKRTGFQDMHVDTNLTVKDATDAKNKQVRRLRDTNPKEDVPEQDSAIKFSLYLCSPNKTVTAFGHLDLQVGMYAGWQYGCRSNLSQTLNLEL